MHQTMTQREEVKKSLGLTMDGFPLLGFLVVWSISGIRVRYDDFCRILTEVGLDPDIAPPVQTKSALVRAIREHNRTQKGSYHHKVVDSKERAGFAIGDTETDDTNIDVNFNTRTRAVLDKTTDEVTIEGDNAQALADTFSSFEDIYTSDKFRSVVLKIVRQNLQGISWRDRGGIYFVPAFNREIFHSLQKLFENFPECRIEAIPVIDAGQAKTHMWAALTSDVREEMAKFQEDVAQLDLDPSERAVSTRLERHAALQKKIESYESLLTGTAADLKEELMAVTRALLAKVSDTQE